jgi:site-specific DNA-cytosine methylase
MPSGPTSTSASLPCRARASAGLLSQKQIETKRYQALNGLTLRGVWLLLEAYKDDPIPIVLFENVPRIANRGRWLLDQIIAILRHYGYAVAETVHDCGELGGLAQSRKRFLLIARHQEKVPPFVYQPPKRKLRGVGEVIGKLPLPGDPLAGPMHRVPSLQWQTWVRLAFVPAGKDWRALNELRGRRMAAAEGLRHRAGDPAARERARRLRLGRYRAGRDGRASAGARPLLGCRSATRPVTESIARSGRAFGVSLVSRRASATVWHKAKACQAMANSASLIRARAMAMRDASQRPRREGLGRTGRRRRGDPKPTGGAHAVADPRVDGHPKSVQLGVRSFEDPAPCVKGDMSVGTGPYAVADPRWANDRASTTLSGSCRSMSRAGRRRSLVVRPAANASPIRACRLRTTRSANTRSRRYDAPARAVIGASTTGDGAFRGRGSSRRT